MCGFEPKANYSSSALELRFYKSHIVFTFRLECNERFGSGGGAVCVLCGGQQSLTLIS